MGQSFWREGLYFDWAGGRFVETHSRPMGCFREVQVNTTNGGDALNTIRDESGEVGKKMSPGAGHLLEQDSSFVETLSRPMGCFREVQVNTTNGGDALNTIMDESGEVGKKMSNVAGCLLEWDGCFVETHSRPMGCFREVQVNTTNGGDALNAIRDDSGEVGKKMSTGASCLI